jgi:hypothetical protein
VRGNARSGRRECSIPRRAIDSAHGTRPSQNLADRQEQLRGPKSGCTAGLRAGRRRLPHWSARAGAAGPRSDEGRGKVPMVLLVSGPGESAEPSSDDRLVSSTSSTSTESRSTLSRRGGARSSSRWAPSKKRWTRTGRQRGQRRFEVGTEVGTPRPFAASTARLTRMVEPDRLAHAAPKGAYGIRTRAAAVRGRCPRPLDECAAAPSVARRLR